MFVCVLCVCVDRALDVAKQMVGWALSCDPVDVTMLQKNYGKTLSTRDFLPEILNAINALRDPNVVILNALREADPQLAALSRCLPALTGGLMAAILTNDGDITPFHGGLVSLIVPQSWRSPVECLENLKIRRLSQIQSDPAFGGWSDRMWLMFAALSGCDYLANEKGTGCVRAFVSMCVCVTHFCVSVHVC